MMCRRRSIFRIFVVLLLCLAACSGQAQPDASLQPGPTPYAPPREPEAIVRLGVEPMVAARADALEAEINRLLEEESAAVRIDIVDELDEFLGQVRSGPSGDLVDLFVAGRRGRWDYAELAGYGFATDITDLLVNHPALREVGGEALWAEATLDGRIRWIPAERASEEARRYELEVDAATLLALGMKFPRAFEEMVAILREAKTRGLPHKLMVPTYTTSISSFSQTTTYPPAILHRTYDEWPFFVDRESFFIYDADGGMEPYIGSAVFQRDVENLRQLDEEGLLYWRGRAEPISEEAQAEIAMGMMGAWVSEVKAVDVATGILEPERPRFRIEGLSDTALFIPESSPHPEAALALAEAMMTNPAINRALAYGIEGTDWQAAPDGSPEPLSDGFLPDLFRRMGAEVDALPPPQALPFSGFAFHYDYGNRGYVRNERLMGAVQRGYDILRGALPLADLEAVRQGMYDEGFQRLYDDTRESYAAYRAAGQG